MTFKSHITLGVIGGLTLGYFTPIGEIKNYYQVLMPLVALGSVMPDIDEPRSFIGRKLPIISHIISLTFTHRGFTHFLICPLLISIIGGLFLDEARFYVYALCFGMFMHQIGDMLTKSGIPYYFFPFKGRAVLLPKALRFYTGGAIEKIILITILAPLLGLLSYQILIKGGGENVIPKDLSYYYKEFK